MRLFSICMLLLLLGCSGEEDAGPLVLERDSFRFWVDRVCENPEVPFPHSLLHEGHYTPVLSSHSYLVEFLEGQQRVVLWPDSISGALVASSPGHRAYQLEAGLQAGGRFVVTRDQGAYRAEYTIYGSGVPVIRSERGLLQLE